MQIYLIRFSATLPNGKLTTGSIGFPAASPAIAADIARSWLTLRRFSEITVTPAQQP